MMTLSIQEEVEEVHLADKVYLGDQIKTKEKIM